MAMVIDLCAADILKWEVTQLQQGIIYGKPPLPHRMEHRFEKFLIHECVPAASNLLVQLYHACGSFPCKTCFIVDITPSKKCSPVYFFPADMLQVLNTESMRGRKWVKQLQKKYLMRTW
jgi:hypothetical protein